jgi:hypothetical protein
MNRRNSTYDLSPGNPGDVMNDNFTIKTSLQKLLYKELQGGLLCYNRKNQMLLRSSTGTPKYYAYNINR